MNVERFISVENWDNKPLHSAPIFRCLQKVWPSAAAKLQSNVIKLSICLPLFQTPCRLSHSVPANYQGASTFRAHTFTVPLTFYLSFFNGIVHQSISCSCNFTKMSLFSSFLKDWTHSCLVFNFPYWFLPGLYLRKMSISLLKWFHSKI